MLAQVDPGLVAAVITLGGSIVGGALIMAWRLGALSTRVDNLKEQLRMNTNRLDLIEAKADGAKESAQAAVAAATAVARSTGTS